MHRSNRIINLILLFALTMCLCITGCKKNSDAGEKVVNDQPVIVASLFPQYDFARAIVGDKMQVELLLPPGMESHSYDPTPADMITIKNADMFVYTGKYMETWAETLIKSLDDVMVVDCSSGIELVKETHENDEDEEHEEEQEHKNAEHEDHEHENEEHEEAEHDAHHGHHHEYDPHIWTSPKMAVDMLNNILEAVCALDPANESYYRENAADYIEKILFIDGEFRDISNEFDERSLDKTIYFGGKFAMTYFVREYGFEYMSAFPDCSAEGEPAIKDVVRLIDAMKVNGSKAVFYEELVDPKIARTISEETGADIYLLHSAHNVSKKELESSVTYVDIMQGNVDRLREILD